MVTSTCCSPRRRTTSARASRPSPPERRLAPAGCAHTTFFNGIGSLRSARVPRARDRYAPDPRQPEGRTRRDFDYPSNLAPPRRFSSTASGRRGGAGKFGGGGRADSARRGRACPRRTSRARAPIMFSGGFGQIDHSNLEKQEGDIGMLVVKIGGPAYRIGMGRRRGRRPRLAARTRRTPTSTSTRCSAGTRRCPTSSTASSRRAWSSRGGTRFSPSTTKARGATATCARSSSTPRAASSTSER